MPNSDAVLLFHQGWTDILNSLALITYYAPRYENLYVIIRSEGEALLQFYCRTFKNVQILSVAMEVINYAFVLADIPVVNSWTIETFGLDPSTTDKLFHGSCDFYRCDKYNNTYHNSCTGGMFFVNAFYTPYGLDPSLRISHFTVERDHNREQEFYTAFCKKHGDKYHLTHGTHTDNPLAVELGNTTETFFDAIQVLEHAQSMILIDSVWATLVYLLQAKYGLFYKTPITIVSRGHGYEGMFYQPVRFSNWSFLHLHSDLKKPLHRV